MKYLVQENIFKDIHYNLLFDALERLGLEYEIFSFKTSKLENNEEKIFIFGGCKLAQLASKYEYYPGSLFNEKHDFVQYLPFYLDNLLNFDSHIQKLELLIDFQNTKKFIRPTKDSKIFTGSCFSEIEWLELTTKLLPLYCGDLIQISTPKKILCEARIWVVDSKIITSSYYKIGDSVIYKEGIDRDGLEFAEKMIQLFQPAKAFCMDVCLTEIGWKIVELNCINSAGFYKADLQLLLIALENLYD